MYPPHHVKAKPHKKIKKDYHFKHHELDATLEQPQAPFTTEFDEWMKLNASKGSAKKPKPMRTGPLPPIEESIKIGKEANINSSYVFRRRPDPGEYFKPYIWPGHFP